MHCWNISYAHIKFFPNVIDPAHIRGDISLSFLRLYSIISLYSMSSS